MDSNGTTATNGVEVHSPNGALTNGQSTTTNSTPSPVSSSKNRIPEHHRVCHVIKRSDFSGYGFHLHAEKGKPGQFIGKVDPDSPAEEAGLRQGDRIIEVNNVAINQETHKEVVERIKALEQEVRLMVLDASQDPTGAALAKKDTSTVATNGTKAINNSTKVGVVEEKKNGNAMKIETSTTAIAAAKATPTATKLDDLSSDLQLSVAEFRAKLANKKKVDPKRESVDIKKKYEMVQML